MSFLTKALKVTAGVVVVGACGVGVYYIVKAVSGEENANSAKEVFDEMSVKVQEKVDEALG